MLLLSDWYGVFLTRYPLIFMVGRAQSGRKIRKRRMGDRFCVAQRFRGNRSADDPWSPGMCVDRKSLIRRENVEELPTGKLFVSVLASRDEEAEELSDTEFETNTRILPLDRWAQREYLSGRT